MTSEIERHVIVVGAGIIGASIAWHAARAGNRVTIIDADEVGGVATPCSFGWVNATHGNPRAYFDLRMASMKSWRALSKKHPGIPYRQSGTVYLHFEGHAGSPIDLPAFADSHSRWGYDIGVVGGNALRAYAPNVRELPDVGLWAPCEGVAEGSETARFLIKDCIALGATVIAGAKVEKLLSKGGRVTGAETRLGPILGDEVVVAAGAATPNVIQDVAPPVPLEAPQGILVHTKPHAPLIPHITLTKDLHIRQATDGSILAGWDFGGGDGPDEASQAAEALLDKIRATFHGAEDVELADVTVGYRPTPKDGFPVVGRPGGTPGLIVAVMHSGITLAPIVGEAVSEFIETGKMYERLQPYAPDRFDDV